MVLSATREVEPGARVMVVLADGLFRLDAVVLGDTIKTVVRNLSAGELTLGAGSDGSGDPTFVFGDGATYEPGVARLEFAIGAASDRVAVHGTLATLKLLDRGLVRLTAQVVVRHAPA